MMGSTTTSEPRVHRIQFGDFEPKKTDIPSSWRQTKHVEAKEQQTAPIQVKNTSNQSMHHVNDFTQTEPEPPLPSELLQVSYDSLFAFTKNVESCMSRELMQNVRSKAFDGYTVQWEDKIDSVQLVHTLQHQHDLTTNLTDIAWNKSGSIVAAALGRLDHTGFCQHKGMVCAWNIALREMNPDKASFVAETSSCVTQLAFHPSFPSILAVGTFTGHIIIYDLNNTDDPVIAQSKMDKYTHQEPVAKMVWVDTDWTGTPGTASRGNTNRWRLVTAASDGKILIWDIGNRLSSPVGFTQVYLSHLPRSIAPKSTRGDVNLGITAMAHIPFTKDILIGTESGYILKLNLDLVVQLGSTTQTTQDLTRPPNPITQSFNPHSGPVYSISPHTKYRNLFITSGGDGSTRLYSLLQSKELQVWYPSKTVSSACYDCEWSATRDGVLCVASSDGGVYIYDLLNNFHIPSVSLSHTTEVSSNAVTCVSFNTSPSRQGYLATGDISGSIKIWRLSTVLEEHNVSDDAVLKPLNERIE